MSLPLTIRAEEAPVAGDAASFRGGTTRTTQTGYINLNRQQVLGTYGLPGNDHLQVAYGVRCLGCCAEYGANGSDCHLRRCPACQGGAAGLVWKPDGC